MALCRDAGLTLAPTFVAFTPWTTLEGYCLLLHAIDRLGLVEHVAPIQLAIRLLVTEGSRLLELPEISTIAPTFDAASLTYPWQHPDPRVDRLQQHVASLVGDGEERVVRPGVGGRARRRRRRRAGPAGQDAVRRPRFRI